MKAKTLSRSLSPIGPFALVLLLAMAALAPTAGAGMMDEKKMDTMGMHEEMSRTGTLTGIEGHNASGTVKLQATETGAVLLLRDIEVDKVPDGRVYLGKGGDHRRGVELGRLEQFSGDLSFAVADDVELGAYDSVVIWCEKFDVGIGRAMLDGDGM